MLYQTLVIILLLLPFSSHVIIEINSHQWLQLILLGIFFTALPHTLFAMVFLAELPDWTTIAGGLIVISAAVYETIATVKQKT